ncbi:fumarate reductase [Anaeramoeba flamelloides]|uniref:Fumarate reductase n=1 Tax=Anaeramoeba flamelloides TaxID=1746091 RepID=A0ABQ8Z2L2_9EUKA|nr:fumarate reductase [Anaeramoeba flamelloides]
MSVLRNIIISLVVLLCSIYFYQVKFQAQKPVVVVVGCGLAGISAGIEAHRSGAHVIILEKTQRCAGNSFKATSGINGAYTEVQKSQNINDTVELFIQDTIKSGKGLANKQLVNVLVNKSRSAIEFLQELGVDLSVLSQCGGHSRPRTHRSRPTEKIRNIGMIIMYELLGKYEEKLEIIKEANVLDIEPNEFDNSLMVHYSYKGSVKKVGIKADSVILASGGWCADKSRDSLLKKYRPDIFSLATTNGQFATGDGVKIAKKLGINLVHMDKIQVHPTGFISPKDPLHNTKMLCPEAVRASGGIMINSKGERFANELGTRDYLTKQIFDQKDKYKKIPKDHDGESDIPYVATIIMTEESRQLFNPTFIDFYQKIGLIQYFENGEKLSEYLEIDQEKLKNTFQQYEKDAEVGKDRFGKTIFPVKKITFDENLYMMTITPSIHYAMGGIEINENAQVINEKGGIIPNIYAAGETTGGVHGDNRLAGNSLLECVVFGRISGKNSVNLLDEN